MKINKNITEGGLIGAGIFTWILSFPFYGCLLFNIFPEKAVWYGHTFVLGHAIGYLMLPYFKKLVLEKSMISNRFALWLAAFFLLAGCGTAFFRESAFLIPAFATLGAATSFVAVTWAKSIAEMEMPFLPLAFAMALSNILLQINSIFACHDPDNSKFCAAALTLMAATAYLLASRKETKMPFHAQLKDLPAAQWIPLALFGAAAYTGGGIAYRVFLPYAAATSTGTYAGLAPYIIAIILAAAASKKFGYQVLMPWAFGALGIGFSLWAAEIKGIPTNLAGYIIVLSGLAGADLYYWTAICTLSSSLKSIYPLAWGLAWNTALITTTGILWDMFPQISGYPPLAGTAGAVILFCLIPLLSAKQLPAQLAHKISQANRENHLYSSVMESLGEKEKTESLSSPHRESLSIFTKTEIKIIEEILKGKPDRMIAEALYISQHTVKFHVRNILRKSKCKNRKEFRERFGIIHSAASEPAASTETDEERN